MNDYMILYKVGRRNGTIPSITACDTEEAHQAAKTRLTNMYERQEVIIIGVYDRRQIDVHTR